MTKEAIRKMRSWLSSNSEQLFDTGDAVSTITIRIDALWKAIQAYLLHPNIMTFGSILIISIALMFSVVKFYRVMRRIPDHNTSEYRPSNQQEGKKTS